MIKDFFVSFKDNFKEKIRNPFLGTYLIVWIVRNWELVYTLFNFDNDQKLKSKVDFIKAYYTQKEFLNNLGTNIYWAFGLLILTYILLNLSRLIVNLSEKRLTPWVYKITDSKSIVLLSVYEGVRTERDELAVRLDQERESKSRLESRIKSLESEITEIRTPQTDKSLNESITKIKEPSKTPNADAIILINKLKSKDLLKDFIDTTVRINRGDYINNNYKPKDYFIELGLISFLSDHFSGEKKMYTITPDGENVLRDIRFSA